jgi:cytidine deaminase
MFATIAKLTHLGFGFRLSLDQLALSVRQLHLFRRVVARRGVRDDRKNVKIFSLLSPRFFTSLRFVPNDIHGVNAHTNKTMTPTEQTELIQSALDAQSRAFCPYSNFPVGAALRGKSGRIYQGVNVENASFGLTNCAERVAIGAAIAAGEREFTDIAVVSRGGVTPCGACRQVLAEFAPNLQIVMVDSEKPGEVHHATIDVLLPGRFDGRSVTG